MPTFICSLGWTEQGIKAVKDAPKRAKAARDSPRSSASTSSRST